MSPINVKYPFVQEIAIIDNKQAWVQILLECLQPHAIDVCIARDLESALQLVERRRFDLALIDQNLKLENTGGDELGLEVIEAIRAAGDDTFCSIVTAFPEVDPAVQSLKYSGADHYVDKKDIVQSGIGRVEGLLVEADAKLQRLRRQEEYRRRCESNMDRVLTRGDSDIHFHSIAQGIASYGPEFRDDVHRLLYNGFPYVSEVTGRSVLRLHRDGALAISNLWSRGFGKACLVLIGQRNTVGVFLEDCNLDLTPFVGEGHRISTLGELRTLDRFERNGRLGVVKELAFAGWSEDRSDYGSVISLD